ncbi:hypothetical protein KP509_29G044700 [Ceratopteris richardii]|uniref:Uncharacterized protein n=1 Tax=Ceratopteris richardii TaxID=49495 RepID=A0A8T2R7J4_CERRI|nr:hypothetical protein KP509_29G044700 [Ceratopteris richardii]
MSKHLNWFFMLSSMRTVYCKSSPFDVPPILTFKKPLCKVKIGKLSLNSTYPLPWRKTLYLSRNSLYK